MQTPSRGGSSCGPSSPGFSRALSLLLDVLQPGLRSGQGRPAGATGRWSANQDGQAACRRWAGTAGTRSTAMSMRKRSWPPQLIVDKGLREAGYRYINIDDGWWLRRRQPDGRMVIRADKFSLRRRWSTSADQLSAADRPTSRHGVQGGDLFGHRPQQLRPGLHPISPTSPKARSPSARSGCTAISIRISRSISANGASIISRSTAAAFVAWARTATMSARATIASWPR